MEVRIETGAECPELLSWKQVVAASPTYPGLTSWPGGVRPLLLGARLSPPGARLRCNGARALSAPGCLHQAQAGLSRMHSRFCPVGLAFHRLKASYLSDHSLLAPLARSAGGSG